MKARTTYLLFLLLIITSNSYVYGQSRVNSSKITCLEILSDDSVRITWSKSTASLFDSYTLFYSSDGNNFDSLTSYYDINHLTHVHKGINALKARKYYKIRVNGGQDLDISPKASTLFILGIDVDPNGYQADIFWTPFSDPMPNTTGTYDYKVYNYEAELPLLIGQTNDNFYRNIEKFVCDDDISFSITMESNGCISNSPIVSAHFADLVLPDKPVLDSVSVTPAGNVILGWTQSDSMDVVGNYIYLFDGLKWNIYDTTLGYNTQTYQDISATPCSENYLYAISSFDSCENNSPFTSQTAQRPIFLYDIPYSVCDLQDTLKWTIYINPKNPIDEYQIWSSKENGPFQLIGTVTDIAGKDELIYVHKNLDPGVKYNYFIRVKMGDITSSSCIKEVHTASYILPDTVSTTTADVLEDNTVKLTIEGDMKVNKCAWDIWRLNPDQTDTTHIDQVLKPGQSISPFFISDSQVDASINPWFYYATVIDSCGKLRLTSNLFKTIWLQADAQDNIYHLKWTAPGGWIDGVEKYYIYRTTPGVEPVSPIDSVNGTTLEYSEAAPTEGIEDGRSIYFVRALKKTTTDERITSTSNRAYLYKEASFYFANAFRPDGLNKEFKPVFSFFGGTAYLFQIYNRWGKLIFETSDPEKGWDGTYQNELVEQGSYIYVFSYRSVNGENITSKGTVTLIK